jgi:O-antigen/teichoic acid export membrane protein
LHEAPQKAETEPESAAEVPRGPGRRGGRSAASRVGQGAGAFMAGELVDRALGFAFLLVATKLFGLSLYGVYLLALSAFQVVSIGVSFGLGKTLVREIAGHMATGEKGRAKGAVVFGLVVSLSLSLVAGALLVAGAGWFVAAVYPQHLEMVSTLRMFGLLTPLFALNFVMLQSLYGVGRIRMMVAANSVVEPTVRIAALAALYLSGLSGYVALPAAYMIALAASTAVVAPLFLRHVWGTFGGVRSEVRARETIGFAIPVALNDLATRSLRAVNLLVLGRVLPSADISVFSVAIKLTGVVFFFSGSLMGAFRPRIAELSAAGRREDLAAEARVCQRLIFTVALAVTGTMILFPAPFLAVMGPQFVTAAPTLRILCTGLFVAQAAGPLMALLVMSGRPRPPLVFLVSAAGVYAALAFALTPLYGVEGTALAIALTILIFVLALSAYVQRTMKIRVYDRSIWKPVAAGLVAFAAGAAVSLVLPGRRFVDAALLGGVILSVYAALLAAFGIAPEDRAMLAAWLWPLKKLKKLMGR